MSDRRAYCEFGSAPGVRLSSWSLDGVWGSVDGVPITDEVIERVVRNAEAGFPGAKPRPVGRPLSVGTKAARTVTVRLDDARAQAVKDRADEEHVSASEVMRRALDRYLAS